VDDSLKNILQTLPLQGPASRGARHERDRCDSATRCRVLLLCGFCRAGDVVLGILFILTALKVGTLLFVVPQYETVIITRFGKIVRTITTPGLKMKLPIIDKLQRFDKRIPRLGGATRPNAQPKISSTSSSIVSPGGGSAIRCCTTIGSMTSGARSRAWTTFSAAKPAPLSPRTIWSKLFGNQRAKPVRDEELEKTGTVLPTTIPDIEYGRGEIEKQITERTRQKIADFGIELLDERFKRSKYNPAVAEKIIERMSSERHQIAARFRSEGRGEAANINGQKESDVASISSTATKNALEIEGKADAEAAAIYAAAFGAPESQELYTFLRSLDVMRAAFEKDTTASSRPTAISAEC
jgi:membrane protease subunit HflC